MKWLVVAAVAVVVSLAFTQYAVAQRRLRWTSECYGTLDGMVQRLNVLPPQSGDLAQVMTVPSERNVGGWLGSPLLPCISAIRGGEHGERTV